MSDKPLPRTRKDVELVEVGESWMSSTGEFTMTHEHLVTAVVAQDDAAVRTPHPEGLPSRQPLQRAHRRRRHTDGWPTGLWPGQEPPPERTAEALGVLDRFRDGIGNPSVRVDYAISTSLCTPGSLAQPGRYGLGPQGGPAVRLALLAEAGFRNPTLAADTGLNLGRG